MQKRLVRRIVIAAAVLLAAAAVQWIDQRFAPAVSDGEAVIVEAFRDHRSDVWVEVDGSVSRLLADDNEGSRHQRFIVRLSSGHTLMVAHNIDLADRVPLEAGHDITLRGEYEYNDRGGVLHWTHDDPSGRRDGGWIRYEGRVYR